MGTDRVRFPTSRPFSATWTKTKLAEVFDSKSNVLKSANLFVATGVWRNMSAAIVLETIGEIRKSYNLFTPTNLRSIVE